MKRPFFVVPNYHRVRGCTGKRKYATREIAEEALEAVSKKWKVPEPMRLNAYRCQFCQQFHLGRTTDDV